MAIIIELRKFSCQKMKFKFYKEAWSLLFSIALSYKGF